jgi:glycosyltransferase involved in cell wall biosynthesis
MSSNNAAENIAIREALPRFRALRLKAQSLYYKSVVIQTVSSWVLGVIVRVLVFFGSNWKAASLNLRILRHQERPEKAKRYRSMFDQLVSRACYRNGALEPLRSNQFLHHFLTTAVAQNTVDYYSALPTADCVRMRVSKKADDPTRQGNLIVLKRADVETGEKGVLLIKYNPAIMSFPALFDLPKVAMFYRLVLEPSWWGYQHQRFLPYLGSDLDVVVMAQYGPDFDFIHSLKSNLRPLRIGPADWVDPKDFLPKTDSERRFDIVHLAAWSPFKRHWLLFEAVSKIKREHGIELRVALIGYPWDWTAMEVEKLAKKYGILDQVSIFERIPHAEVASILADSRLSVCLSHVEGSPKALQESLFAGTPVVVYKHNKGIDLQRFDERVGFLVDDHEVKDAILRVIQDGCSFDPVGWAVENTGFAASTERVNNALKEIAESQGEVWSHNIVPKRNAPHLRYAHEHDRQSLVSEYERLVAFKRSSPMRPANHKSIAVGE